MGAVYVNAPRVYVNARRPKGGTVTSEAGILQTAKDLQIYLGDCWPVTAAVAVSEGLCHSERAMGLGPAARWGSLA